jgi:putative sugar O-methyltransferase
VVTTVARAMPIIQVDEDLRLLHEMVADMKSAAPIYQPTHYWAAYERPVLDELRKGLRDFRRRDKSILATFGATDPPPAMLTSIDGIPPEGAAVVGALVGQLNEMLAAGHQILPECLAMTDVFELAYLHCLEQMRRAPTIRSIDELEVSRAGNPFGYERDGRFLTMSALYYYMRYAFVAEHLDLRDVDVVVELGSGSGKQVEILKRLYPHLTFVLLDLGPQLYVAERLLTAAFPDDVVPYRATRAPGSLDIEPAKIHFVGNHRIEDLEPEGRVLFWNAASMGEMEPDVVAHYAKAVSRISDWLYLCQCFSGKERATESGRGGVLDPVVWPHYVDAFAEHEPIDQRPAHTGLTALVQGGRAYDDTFWAVRTQRAPGRSKGAM